MHHIGSLGVVRVYYVNWYIEITKHTGSNEHIKRGIDDSQGLY